MKIGEKFWAVFDAIIKASMALASALIVFDAIAVTVEVLLRYSFGIVIGELFEITEYTLLWMTFLGAAWIMKKEGHVSVEVVVDRLSPEHRAIVRGIAYVLCIFLLLVMVWYSAKLTLSDFQAHFTLSSIMMPPKWPIEIIIPIGFFLLIIQLMRNAYGYFSNWRALYRGESISPTDVHGRGL
ncbi:MAG: TRAP transporter small permease [Dehalococcoidia bacterium]